MAEVLEDPSVVFEGLVLMVVFSVASDLAVECLVCEAFSDAVFDLVACVFVGCDEDDPDDPVMR